MDFKYTFTLRPAYHSTELLIELNAKQDADAMLQELQSTLSSNGFEHVETRPLWMNDEIIYDFASANGKVELSRDVWDLFFIMAPANQKDILVLDKVLEAHQDFERLEVDFSEYR